MSNQSQIIYPLGDQIGSVQRVDSMGSDISVVNAARVSFDRESRELTEADKKLISYLIQHKHFSPLRGISFTFKIKAPLFLCRQIWKHIVASAHIEEQIQHNEVSLRYVNLTEKCEFYIPEVFRQQSSNNKQATFGELDKEINAQALSIYKAECKSSEKAYQDLIELGVGREQARGVLVPAVYTSWIWCSSLQSILNFVDLRKGEGAQSEIQKYAEAIEELIKPIVPVTIEAWNRFH